MVGRSKPEAKGRKANGGLLRMAERAGIARGVFGTSKGWFYVGTGLWTLRTVRRLAARQPEILLSEELRPGDRLVIANGRATLDSAPAQVAVAAASAVAKRRRRSR